MKTKRRWLNTILLEAAKIDAAMPWTRGETRKRMITRRSERTHTKAVARA